MNSPSFQNPGQIALFLLVANIPKGKVASYGQLAAYLPSRTPALVVGRWMAQCPAHLPWWRVMASDGRLVIARRNPAYAVQQAKNLAAENTPFLQPDQVDIERCRWMPDDSLLEQIYLSGG